VADLGFYVEKDLSSNTNLFLREKLSEQRSAGLERDATGLWIGYVPGKRGLDEFTGVNLAKAKDWLFEQLRELRVFQAGDTVGYGPEGWWNHNVYRLVSPAGPGSWNVENLVRMPKHEPKAVLEEKDMVKIPDWESEEEERKEREERTKQAQVEAWKGEWKPGELEAYVADLRSKGVPESYLKRILESNGADDIVRKAIEEGIVERDVRPEGLGGQSVHETTMVHKLLQWPDFELTDGRRININFIRYLDEEEEKEAGAR
jgi:hypothetical protein